MKWEEKIKMIFEGKVKKKFILFFCAIALAIIWYSEKSENIPQYGVVFYEMGVNCKDDCSLDQKLQYFQKAIHYNPNMSNAYYHIGLIYEEKRNHDKAIAFFNKAIDYDQENVPVYYRAGVHLFNEGDYEGGLRYFQQCYKRPGCPSDKHYYLARIHDYREEYELAILQYQNTILLRPEYTMKIYPRLAEIYYSQKDIVLKMIAHQRSVHYYDSADQLEQLFKTAQASGGFNQNESF